MNIQRKILRIWLNISSFIGFLTGWVLLAHIVETKSVNSTTSTTIQSPAQQAIPTVQSVNQNSALNTVQSFNVTTNTSQSQSVFSPRLRTGGS